MAYLRGNRDFKAELTFAYVEPYVIPKHSLTGGSTERVDTRVLQVVYSFPSGAIRLTSASRSTCSLMFPPAAPPPAAAPPGSAAVTGGGSQP